MDKEFDVYLKGIHTEQKIFKTFGACVCLTSFNGLDEKLFQIYFHSTFPPRAKYSFWTSSKSKLTTYTQRDFCKDVAYCIAKECDESTRVYDLIPMELLMVFLDLYKEARMTALRFYFSPGVKTDVARLEALNKRINILFSYSLAQPNLQYQLSVLKCMDQELLDKSYPAYELDDKILQLKEYRPKIIQGKDKKQANFIMAKQKYIDSLELLQYELDGQNIMAIAYNNFQKAKTTINKVRRALVSRRLARTMREKEITGWE